MFGKLSISRVAALRLLAASATLLALAPWVRAQNQDQGVLPFYEAQWAYHMGDDPNCASGTDSACAWQPYSFKTFTNLAIGEQGYWKRSEITLTGELKKTPRLALLIPSQYHLYEVYANGQDIGGTGRTGFFQTSGNSRRILTFPSSLAPDGRLTLTIRSFKESGTSGGGALGIIPYVVSPADRIQAIKDAVTLVYLRTNFTHYLCFAAAGCAGFVFLLLFSVNSQLREYLWLGAGLATVSVLRLVEISPVLSTGMPLWLTTALFETCNDLTPLILIEFVFSFLKRPVPKAFRLLQVLGFTNLYIAFHLPIAPSLIWYVGSGTAAAILLASLAQLLLLPTCFRSKLPEMRWIGASMLFIVVENSFRMAGLLNIHAPTQDVMWHGLDIDLRGISYLLFAIVMLVAMTFRLRRIQNRNREIEQEMAAARSVQQILIPDELPSVPGLAVESAYLPAQQVGGDFFQVLPARDGGPLLVVGDVSGKGLPAAMLVSVLVGAIRSTAEFTSAPAELLAHLNERLVGRVKGAGFSTAVAAFIAHDGRVTISNAGHLSPYLDGREIEISNALPLGIVRGTTYESSQLYLGKGSRLTFYSDGVVEAQNQKGELFGFQRGLEISTQSASAIVEAARRFGQSDDITVVTIERLANGEESKLTRVEPMLAPA
jgi:sigma-B regulation protein RsbU (phosphoserine phosphatase)